MRERSRLALLGVVLLSASFARSASASLVIFEDGRHLHASDFLVDEDMITLFVEGGGSMTIPLERVSRIVDDEVDHAVPAPPETPAKPAVPGRSIRTSQRPPGLKPVPFESQILSAAKEHRVDPALIAAVIRAESNFAPHAISRKGARGLMQLMPATAKRLGVKRSFDPRENIRGGAAYLAELAERYGDSSVDLILAAYNAGERAVDEYGGVPPYRETQDYVRRVTGFWSAAYGDGTAGPKVATAGGG